MSMARRNSVSAMSQDEGIIILPIFLIKRSDRAISDSMKCVVRDQSFLCRSMASARSLLWRCDIKACPATDAVKSPIAAATTNSVIVKPMA